MWGLGSPVGFWSHSHKQIKHRDSPRCPQSQGVLQLLQEIVSWYATGFLHSSFLLPSPVPGVYTQPPVPVFPLTSFCSKHLLSSTNLTNEQIRVCASPFRKCSEFPSCRLNLLSPLALILLLCSGRKCLGTLFRTNANVHLLLRTPTSYSLTPFEQNPDVSQLHISQQLLWKPALPIWEYLPGGSVLFKHKVIKTTSLPDVGEWLTSKQ